MKYLFILFILLSYSASAQWKSYKIGPKGDTLNRVDNKGLKQGPWVLREENVRGERGYEEEGYFENDRKEGLWRRYTLEGDLIALENYKWGSKHGVNQYFSYQGEPLREESWRAIDPKNPYDTVPVFDVDNPNKVAKYVVVKIENSSVKHGVWKYFDVFTGKVETERWIMDKLKKENEEVTDELAPIDVTKGGTTKTEEKKQVQKPKEVLEFEKKNAGKKKIKVRDGRTGG